MPWTHLSMTLQDFGWSNLIDPWTTCGRKDVAIVASVPVFLFKSLGESTFIAPLGVELVIIGQLKALLTTRC